MEILVAIMLIIVVLTLIKYLFKKLLKCIFVLGFTGIISFIYKIPYSITLSVFIIMIYSIYAIFSELKYMGSNLIKPCSLYLHGFYEKLVCVLFSLNYIIFMTLCYIILMYKSIFMIDLTELAIAFSLTWIGLWVISYCRKIFFKYINTSQYEISK